MSDQQQYLEQGLINAREAARKLARCDNATICSVLESLADRAISAESEILQANLSDLSRMPESDPKYDRLLLNPERLRDIAGAATVWRRHATQRLTTMSAALDALGTRSGFRAGLGAWLRRVVV